MSSIIKGLVDEQGVEETKKLSAQEKFKRSMKRAGYDMDAGAKRLQDLLAKQKKEREEFEKKEVKEDETLQYAAEVTPKISPYAGIKDRKFRGAIGEGIKQMFENPNESPTDSGYQQGGWRKMNEQEVSEDLRKWFKEKWVRFGPDGKIRGACARGDDSEGKPKCLPQAKAHSLGKKGRKYAAAKKRREDPNPERSGPAKNVATKKKSNESLKEFAPNYSDDGNGASRDIDKLREKIYSLLMNQLANVEGDPQDIAMAAMEVADDIASASEFVDFTKLPKWVEMVLNKVQGVAEAQDLEESFDQPYKLKWYPGDMDEVTAYAEIPNGDDLSIMFNLDANEEGEEAWAVEFYRNDSQEVTGEGDAQRIFATVLSAIKTFIKKYKPNRITFSASKDNWAKQQQGSYSRANLYDRLVQRYASTMGYKAFRADTGDKVIYELSKIAKQVAEGSGKNVVKSVKVGDFRHDLVDTGFGWQVRIYNGDELYDTGMSKNSEQKGLAALEDAVAYTEKQTRTKRQGVAEGTGFDQEAGIGLDGESFKFKIKDLVALANNYPVTPIDPRQFTQQIKGRNEDPTQSMARAEKADLQYPIIVVQRTNGKLWIADGTHRAHKAILNKIPKINAKIIPIKDMSSFFVKQGVAEGYTGRETKDGTWRVFKDGKAVAVAGPFNSREEAAAWIKKQKQGVAEGKEDLHAQLQAINQKLKLMKGGPVGEPNSLAFVEKRKALLKQKEQILAQLKQGVAEGSEELVQIEYWQQETMESGRWVKTKPIPRATAEKIVNSFERGEIVDVEQGVAEGFSDISGLLSVSNLNKSFIITAELAEGGKKKFRVKAQNERVAIEKFKKHHSMAKIINVAEEGVEEGSKYPRNPASYHLKKYPVPQDQLARPVKKEPKKPEQKPEEKLDELKCWPGYTRVKGVPAGAPGSCKKKTNEEHQQCPECGGAMYEASLMNEKKDACYYKVKSRYKVWPSAYASGALVKCRKKGAKNWGSKSKSNEGQIYSTGGGAGEAQRWYTPKDNLGETNSNILAGILKAKE